MDREQRNAAFRNIALEKLHSTHSRSHKLSTKSLVKLEKLDSLFVDQNRRLKSDTLVKVIGELNKLIAEVTVWTEIGRDCKQLTSHKTIVQSAPLQQSPSDASALYSQKDCTREKRHGPVHEKSTKLRRDSLNAEMDKLLFNEISQIASNYDANKCTWTLKNNDNEERLALKYPRKKIDSMDQQVACIVPEIASKRSTSPLYWRRDQIFPKPEVAKTYGEHKRQQQIAAARKRQTVSPITKNLPIKEDMPCAISGSSGVRAVKHALTTIPVDMLLRDKVDGSREVVSVVGREERFDSATTSATNNVLDASMRKNENSVRLAHPVKRDYHIPSKNTCKKVSFTSASQSKVPEHSATQAQENTREIADKSTTKSNPQKKKENKTKGYNRKLNDIILGAVEYGCNSRRKKENDKLKNVGMQAKCTQETERYAESRQKRLSVQGKYKDLRIVLTRIDENDLPVARRTRSKSTDKQTAWMLHKPAEDCSMQDDMQSRRTRRKSVGSRTQHETIPTSQTLTKERTKRAKSMSCKRTNQKEKGTGKRVKSSKKKKDDSPIPKSHCNSSNKLTEDEADRGSSMYLSDTEDGAINMQPLTKKFRKANDNDKVHCQSKCMFNCCLCEYSGSNMVDHYVSKHPDQEVFISRVSPDQADEIRKQPSALRGKCVILDEVRLSISCLCLFCEIVYVLTPNEWIEHIARHTGEFGYCNESKTSIKVNSDIEFSSNHMYAHICDRCNFVQVSSTNMKKHFSMHHSCNYQAVKKYIRFSLVNHRAESEGEHEELLDASICTKSELEFGCDIVNLPLSISGDMPFETNIASEQPASDLCYFQESIVKEEIHFNDSIVEDNRFENCHGMPVLEDVGNCDNFDRHSMVSTDSERTIDMPDIPNVKPDIATIANDIDGQPNEKEQLNYDSDDSMCTIPMDETDYKEITKIKAEDVLAEQAVYRPKYR